MKRFLPLVVVFFLLGCDGKRLVRVRVVAVEWVPGTIVDESRCTLEVVENQTRQHWDGLVGEVGDEFNVWMNRSGMICQFGPPPERTTR